MFDYFACEQLTSVSGLALGMQDPSLVRRASVISS